MATPRGKGDAPARPGFGGLWRLVPVLLLSACSGLSSPPPAPGSSVDVPGVPFFPQSRFQCGPAALAGVLWHSGVATDADALSASVYLPGREGSLQPELLAAARRQGRVPYRIPGTVGALHAELAAGNPVLVLQNLGIEALPNWHYAVLAGYDAARHEWILRSGTEARRRESHHRFMLSWYRAGRWALVVSPPGALPASVDPAQALRAIADAEALLRPGAALASWKAAHARWPDNSDILFATANALRRAGRDEQAGDRYRTLLRQSPRHLAARNNYADLLLQTGCPERARQVLAPALQQVDQASPLAAVLDETAREIARAAGNRGAVCDAGH